MDYSKWDKFADISDSDEEVHPNIDKKSYHKWKREADLQKREENLQRMTVLQGKKELNSEEKKELEKCSKLEEKYRVRFDELKETFSYSSVVGKKQPEATVNEEDFIKQMEIKAQVLAKLIAANSWTQVRDHLRTFPDLICDESETYYLLHFRDLLKMGDLMASKHFCTAALLIKYLLPLPSSARQMFFEKFLNDPKAKMEFYSAADEYFSTASEKLKELWENEKDDYVTIEAVDE